MIHKPSFKKILLSDNSSFLVDIGSLDDDDYYNRARNRCDSAKSIYRLDKLRYECIMLKDDKPAGLLLPERVDDSNNIISDIKNSDLMAELQRGNFKSNAVFPAQISKPIIDDTDQSTNHVSVSCGDLQAFGYIDGKGILSASGVRAIKGRNTIPVEFVPMMDFEKYVQWRMTRLGIIALLRMKKSDKIVAVACDFDFGDLYHDETADFGEFDIPDKNHVETANPADEIDDVPGNVVSGYDVYVELMKSGKFAGMRGGGYTFPGFGHSRELCGKYKNMVCYGSGIDDDSILEKTWRSIARDAKHDSHKQLECQKKLLRCDMISCPECFDAAISKIAHKAANRLLAGTMLMKSVHGPGRSKVAHFNHLVVSIPHAKLDEMKDPEAFAKIEKFIVKTFKSLGFGGGTSIYHPFRFTEKLENAYFSPHFHYISFGYIDDEKRQKIVDIFNATGFIFKSIRTFPDKQNLVVSLKYLLSHAGIIARKHSVKYWGEMHNAKFKTSDVNVQSFNAFEEVDDLNEMFHNGGRPAKSRPTKEFKLTHVTAQRYTFPGEVDVTSWQQGVVVNFDPQSGNMMEDMQKYLIDDNVLRSDTYDRDNPATPKSDFFTEDIHRVEFDDAGNKIRGKNDDYVVFRVDYLSRPINYIEEWQPDKREWKQESRFIVVICTRNMMELCAICRYKRRMAIVSTKLALDTREPEKPGEQSLVDVIHLVDIVPDVPLPVRYVTRDDMMRGFPYYTAEGVLHHDIGVQVRSPHHYSFDMNHRMQVEAEEVVNVTNIRKKMATNACWEELRRKPSDEDIAAKLIEMGPMSKSPLWSRVKTRIRQTGLGVEMYKDSQDEIEQVLEQVKKN